MTDSKLVIQVESTGSARVAGEIGKVTQAVKQNTEAVAQQAQKAKVAGVEIDKFGSTLGIAGQAVGRLNQTAGSMVTTLGAATGAVQSLTTVGLGPLGIAVAAVNVAITAGTALLAAYKEQQSGVALATREAAKSLDELVAAENRRANNRARTQRLQAAQESSAVQRAYVQDAEEQLNRLLTPNAQGQLATPAAAQRALRELERRQQLLRRSEERETLAARDTSDAEAAQGDAAILERVRRRQEEYAASQRSRRGGGGSARANRFGADPESVAANAIRAKREASDEMLRAEAERDAELERTKTQQMIEAQKARDALIYEERMAAEQKITDLLAEQEDERKRIAQEADAARVESFQQTASMVQAIGSSLQQVYGFVDDASAKSDMSAEERQKRELKRMAFVQSVEAIINAANAAAAYARLDIPAGVSYTVASTLNAAAAAKAGIDAGNVRASAGGGAAGGAMRRDSQARSMSSEPSTVVVNMNGPVIAATDRAELGRQLGRIVDEGRARYGS